MTTHQTHPKLRPVEARPSRRTHGAVDIFDRAGISEHVITLSGPALYVVSRMDGSNTRADIQAAYTLRHGSMLFSSDLDMLIEQLDEALLMCGPRFDDHLKGLTRDYRAAPCRPLRNPDSLGAPVHELGGYLEDILRRDGLDRSSNDPRRARGAEKTPSLLRGFIAPHLDYERGAPCYAAAYRQLAASSGAHRFIILGTNHFGRSSGVVGTRQAFETPWGVVSCDRAFMDDVDRRCGVDLCEHEFDHAREHSIELQAILLRHVLPGRAFKIVSYLCPDPCGPTGTRPHDGRGVDLREFALALREAIAADGVPTCVVASADLSHVGRFFQDDHDLSGEYLSAIAESDRTALAFVSKGDAEGFRACVAATQNQSNICSVGCIYTLTTALAGSTQFEMLGYHQALSAEIENCVTCTAFACFEND